MTVPIFARLEGLPEREVRRGVFLRILAGEQMMFSAVRFEPHAAVPTHEHPHEQMGIILEGELELWINEERRTLRAGDMYTVPPHVPHGAETQASSCLVLDVFHPLREDYVKLF